ncbi:MAG TPA: hypothetical protein VJM78_07155, partial [Rhizomicrobium sp.]|nr:hypothetical protein [Rhizomicrobium sp.]
MIFKWAAMPGTGPGCRRLVLRGYSRGFGSTGKTSRNLFPASGDVSLRRIRPAKNLHISVGIFDKGAAAFNPVSVIEIKDIANPAYLGMVDMAANHAVHAPELGLACHELFEPGDILDRVFDLVL